MIANAVAKASRDGDERERWSWTCGGRGPQRPRNAVLQLATPAAKSGLVSRRISRIAPRSAAVRCAKSSLVGAAQHLVQAPVEHTLDVGGQRIERRRIDHVAQRIPEQPPREIEVAQRPPLRVAHARAERTARRIRGSPRSASVYSTASTNSIMRTKRSTVSSSGSSRRPRPCARRSSRA